MGCIDLKQALYLRKQKMKNPIDETWNRLAIQGMLDNNERMLGDYESLEGMWKGQPAFVLGCSRGLKNAVDDGLKFHMLDNYNTIGCNHLVEDYPNLDFLIFQDKRFLDWTTCDLKAFKGRILVHVKNGIQASEKYINYFTQEQAPTLKMVDGLYSYIATGLLALHFAIITGASPIFAIGIDNGGLTNDKNGGHYKEDYPYEVRNHPNWPKKYRGTMLEKVKKFLPYKDKIYNVDPLGEIDIFQKISFKEIGLF